MYPLDARSLARWRRRSKKAKISESELRLYFANLLYGILEPIFAELLVFDVFKLVVHLIELFCGQRLFPRRKNDGIFARSVRPVHPHKRFKRARKLFRTRRSEFRALCCGKDIAGYFPTTRVLGKQDIGIGGSRTSSLLDRREDVSLF